MSEPTPAALLDELVHEVENMDGPAERRPLPQAEHLHVAWRDA